MPPWLSSTDLTVVQVLLSSDTCSRYRLACAFSHSICTRVIVCVVPKSSVRYSLSLKPLPQRVFGLWSMAAAAFRSPRSDELAVALTGVSTVSTDDTEAPSKCCACGLLASLPPPPQAASNTANASGAPRVERWRRVGIVMLRLCTALLCIFFLFYRCVKYATFSDPCGCCRASVLSARWGRCRKRFS